MAIYFGGSRNLTDSPLVSQVIEAVLASGQTIHVGCSVGADALVIQSALRSSSFSQVRVFAAFNEFNLGSFHGSAVFAVQAFAHAGGSVQWLAGGSLAVPLAGRLIQRSLTAAHGCEAAVFFQPGTGSLTVASYLLASMPIYSFSQLPPASIPGMFGSWLPAVFYGFSCWSWSCVQLSLL